MGVTANSDALWELVDENLEIEQLASGCTFTEGPIWNPDGEYLLFSDMPGDTRRRSDAESLLYVNDTDKAHIGVFQVQGDGSISGGDVLAANIGTASLEKMDLVDGMKLDERGNLWVTGPGGIWVIGPDGEHLGSIGIP